MTRVEAAYLHDHLPETLKRVEAGEQVVVTRAGVAVATINPVVRETAHGRVKMTPEEAIEGLRTFNKGIRLNGLSVAEMRREGIQE